MEEQALKIIKVFLSAIPFPTSKDVEEQVEKATNIPGFENLDKTRLSKLIHHSYTITQDSFQIIENLDDSKPWLRPKAAEIQWNFWNRYRDYLETYQNLPDRVINQTSDLNDRTLDGLFDPAIQGSVKKKGMVVGHVQSGKTSNYIGLICKAADAGFKFIIVLAGIHNNLRSQTQIRIDEGFLGFDTAHQRVAAGKGTQKVGVGKIPTKNNLVAHSLTAGLDNGDFSAGAANSIGLNFDTQDPIIAVVKKNSSILGRLHTWLKTKTITQNGEARIFSKSLLIIDDEADNASINTRNSEEEERTKINGHILNIINLFSKSGYVGYTATPFANLFIDIEKDDLFPSDFIINIPAPSNYIGPDKVFGFAENNEGLETAPRLPILRIVKDYEPSFPDKHKSGGPYPDDLPQSLKDAIKTFILSTAIRITRGQDKSHNSMLVHVSRFTQWQKRVAELVTDEFQFVKRKLEFMDEAIFEEFKTFFDGDSDDSFWNTTQEIKNIEEFQNDPDIYLPNWLNVRDSLFLAASRISVKEINGGSAETLAYYENKDHGFNVIAIGGDKLSRGLTLEGLTVSYFLRSSKMYDTLMQMGRWFGYRPGYVDLCRLYLSDELNKFFKHIALATEELRKEFEYLSTKSGVKPKDFAIKVKTHPGVLQISATNKIRNASKITVSWAGRLVESAFLSKEKKKTDANLIAVKNLVNDLAKYPKENSKRGNSTVFRKVDVADVLRFLDNFVTENSSRSTDPQNLSRFISNSNNQSILSKWNVAIMSKSDIPNSPSFQYELPILGNINCYLRKFDKSTTDSLYIQKSHIISPNDEFIDLSEIEYKMAKEETIEKWKSKDSKAKQPEYPSGELVRNNYREKIGPLLLIYLLNPAGIPEEIGAEDFDIPIPGFAISFPGNRNLQPQEYAIHSQLLANFDNQDYDDYDGEED